MPNLYEMCSNTRLRLGDPRANRPGDFQLLNQVCTQVRTLHRHKRNTSNPWNFNDLVIDVTPNQATYQINQADFGTPLAVLSYAPQLPTWIPRLIPFFTPQNMPFDWALPNQLAAWGYLPPDGSQCTAMRCAFFWRDNLAFIEFQPLPQLQASYKVRYLQNVAGQVGQMALTQEPLPNEDCDLAETRAALALLPVSEWWSGDTQEGRVVNAERRRDLAVSLSAEERELTRQFEAAQLVTTGPRMTQRWSGTIVG